MYAGVIELSDEALLEKARNLLQRVIRGQRIKFVFAFGSRVRGGFGKRSDLDLGILFDNSVSFDDALKISAKIECTLSRELNIDVDIVPINFSDLLFTYIAIRNSIFLAGDMMSYCAFKSLVLREFFDFRRLLEEHKGRFEKFLSD